MRDTKFSPSPVSEARDILNEVKAKGATKILVALSGGKDSLCTLDVCVDTFGPENVAAFHLYWLKDLEIDRQILEPIQQRYNLTLVSLPHPAMGDLLKESYGRTFDPIRQARLKSAKYTWKKAEAIARQRTGIQWIAAGLRMQDSLHRRGLLNRCQGVWDVAYKTGKPIRKVYPIYRWRHTDVFSYLHAKKIPIPSMGKAKSHKSFGTELNNPNFILFLKKEYPRDFARIKRLIPGIEAVIQRDMVRASHNLKTRSELDIAIGEDDE